MTSRVSALKAVDVEDPGGLAEQQPIMRKSLAVRLT